MSIQFRLNILIAALMALALVSIISTLILDAAPRIRAESQSSMRLARNFVAASTATLSDSADPRASLERLLAGLTDLRHISVAFEPATSAQAPAPRTLPRPADSRDPARPPRWLHHIVSVAPETQHLPVIVNGASLGAISLTTRPEDEIREIADDIEEVALRALAFAMALFALTSFVINQALRPIGRLAGALTDMRDGDYAVSLPVSGPPEIARISSALNDLAGSLRTTRDDNRRLSRHLVAVADDERRDLARELHDELGPVLFAARSHATRMRTESEQSSPPSPRAGELCSALLEQIDTLQQLNRRVLNKLRPAGLSELGLSASLRGLVANWRTNNPQVTLDLTIATEVEQLEQTVALTVYRIVQEGLTNVFKHARATHITVAISLRTEPGPALPMPRLAIRICDDGAGFPADTADQPPGYGLTGISERVRALGGRVRLCNGPRGGAELDAELPLA